MTSALVAHATDGSLRDGLSSRLRDAAAPLARLGHDGGIQVCLRRARRGVAHSNVRGVTTTGGRAANATAIRLRAGTASKHGVIAERGTRAIAGTIATTAKGRREDTPAVVVAEPGAHGTGVSRVITAAPLATTVH
jgi:hypothetical protein